MVAIQLAQTPADTPRVECAELHGGKNIEASQPLALILDLAVISLIPLVIRTGQTKAASQRSCCCCTTGYH